MKEVTRYVCDHCKFTRATKKTVEKHEAICFKNPATKSCATCANLQVPVVVSVNGKLEVSETLYKEMNLPENKEHLELHQYEDHTEEIYYHNVCKAKGCIKKLTTQCPLWREKEKNNAPTTIQSLLLDAIDKLGKNESLVIPEFLVRFRMPQREYLKKEIIRLYESNEIIMSRTSATFMAHPKTNVLWVNCKKGSRNETLICSLYIFYNHWIYYDIRKKSI